MTNVSENAFSRRRFMRTAAWSAPLIGTVLVAPVAGAAPQECGDPSGKVGNCPAQLPEEFSSTSFSTTAIVNGTNYSILFSTRIRRDPVVPPGATGYRIRSVSISGTKRDGTPFHLTPGIGEAGPRVLGALSASSLGFALDVPWDPNQLVRSFLYAYDVEFLMGLTGIQTCSYTTTMTLADNGMTLGGVGSVTFSPPMLTACDAQPPTPPPPPQ
ncbi:hypothetical protein [Mycolicibacterium sp. XJ870]